MRPVAARAALLRVPMVLAAMVLAAMVLAGCAGLPDRGPVVVEEPAEPSGSAAPFDFNPPGPVPGASQEQVVAGFLRALQATPPSTTPAMEFLTDEAAARWRPGRGTVVYDEARTRSAGATVTLVLDGAFELDERGRYVGDRREASAELALRMAREDGEWRIADAPDALVIPRSSFATRYRQYALYFFDPTGSVLVPEPVHLPWGPQLPTHLVAGLLAGPPPGSSGVERSFFPRSTRLGVSVPVRDDGVAEVPLTEEVLELGADDRERMVAQLAWTLRQVTEVDGLTVTVDGAFVELPGGGRRTDVEGWEGFDPASAGAGGELFAVRAGAVVRVEEGGEETVTQVRGLGGGAPRSLAVSLDGERFAAVSPDGRSVAVLEEDGPPRTVLSGTDLLRPLWDRGGRLWLLDRTPAGARLSVAQGDRVAPLAAPGITGTDVVAAALSRDGTRLAVVQRGGDGDRVAVARVQRDSAGEPVGLTEARPLTTAEPIDAAAGVGWRDPATVAVLTRPSSTTTGVLLASVDGASAAVRQDPTVDLLFDVGASLATDPAAPTRLLVLSRSGRLHALDPQGRWDSDAAPEGLRAPTFPG